MKTTHIIIRYSHLFFAILFVLFAVVQLNDPDAGLWMATYSAAALVSLLSFLGKTNRKVLQACMALTIIGILAMLPNAYTSLLYFDPNLNSEATHTDNVQTEAFKEVGGLLIILGSLIFQYYTVDRNA